MRTYRIIEKTGRYERYDIDSCFYKHSSDKHCMDCKQEEHIRYVPKYIVQEYQKDWDAILHCIVNKWIDIQAFNEISVAEKFKRALELQF